jgi:uncharacterized protein YbbC (DUF1343 family)/CubicO group peptidase (beta-lactamase class C family)
LLRLENPVPRSLALFRTLLALLACMAGSWAWAQPPAVQADLAQRLQALVQAEIDAGKLPGAVVLVGHRGRVVYRQAIGQRAIVPRAEAMTPDTVFDVASLTKVVATATATLMLVERGELRLADTVGRWIPELQQEAAKRVTVLQLLTHVAGYAPDFDLKQAWTGREGMLRALASEGLAHAPGSKFVYSDIGFIVLGEIIERVSGRRLDQFFAQEIATPLGMRDSAFRRLDTSGSASDEAAMARLAPTERIRGQQSYLGSSFQGSTAQGQRLLRGQVHDPTAHRMSGVAGHAGLFSTADDLARFAQMVLNGGALEGRRLLSAASIARMTSPMVVSEEGWTRGLGWDMATPFSANRGELFPLGSFGHTGFTGTSLWIDPVSQTYVVFLSNRVHPDGKGDVTALRAKVMTVVAAWYGASTRAAQPQATGAAPMAAQPSLEDFEAQYAAQVAAQMPRFRLQAERAREAFVPAVRVAPAAVLNGIDVLERNGFKPLAGLRLGLVTNHTGRNRAGQSTIDVLRNAKQVQLVALFSPEHGIRGELDQAQIADDVDAATGLPIYSLYGKSRRPKPEQLQLLDALVFDIQDIGTRFYTYISTLQHVLEEAAKAGKPVFVLDRPNPINGVQVEGPLADADKLSFVATHTLPVRHGMTIGELALMFNRERGIGADVRVIAMEHWRRTQWFDETQQLWVNPSPNMRSLTQATLYPGVGLLEYTNVSVGRGTDTPFEWMGAPYIDGRALAQHLNARGMPGVRFVPVRFQPTASVFKGQWCGGVNIVITDRGQFRSVRVGLEMAAALRHLYPQDWKAERLLALLVHAQTFDALSRGQDPLVLALGLEPGVEAFKRRRQPFLLY